MLSVYIGACIQRADSSDAFYSLCQCLLTTPRRNTPVPSHVNWINRLMRGPLHPVFKVILQKKDRGCNKRFEMLSSKLLTQLNNHILRSTPLFFFSILPALSFHHTTTFIFSFFFLLFPLRISFIIFSQCVLMKGIRGSWWKESRAT